MGRQRGEVSVTRAAELLGAHEDTVRRHAAAAAAGEPSRFSPGTVRKDWSGRWWIQRDEVDRQLEQVLNDEG